MDIAILNHQEVLDIDDKLNQVLEDLIELALKEVLDIKLEGIPGNEIKVVSLNEISLVKSDKVNVFEGGIVLGKLFYRAFLRGGVQGGVWVLDSIQKTIEDKKNLLELFSRWKEY